MKEVKNDRDSKMKTDKKIFVNDDKKHKYCEMATEEIFSSKERQRYEKVNNLTELNNKMSEFNEKIESISKHHLQNDTNNLYTDDKKSIKRSVLRKKIFETRNSLFTDLFNEVKHVKTVYNVFAALFIITFLNTAAHDILYNGSLSLGFTTIKLGFGKLTFVIQMWISMIASSYSVYYVYSFYAHQRTKLSAKSFKIKIWDYTWLLLFIGYQLTFLAVPAYVTLKAELPPPSGFIVLMEQVRLIMKIHAFIRSTVPSVINNELHGSSRGNVIPKLSKFSYFMFAPTLIYQDSYPRTEKIRWRVIAKYLLELAFVIMFVAMIFERFVLPEYKEFGHEEFNLPGFILRAFSTTFPGIVIFLCGFYCLLHVWMNAFAELMRFGDRLFYKDWWNSASFDNYYRTWNVVVHDWLYTYIYKDFYEIVVPGNKFIATFFVFFTSAIVHEYLLGCAFRFFYPMMFVFFGIFGFLLVFITKKESNSLGNIFIWFSLITGSGMLVSFYTMEYFARINCPTLEDNLSDAILPRSWYCYEGISGNNFESQLLLCIFSFSIITISSLLYKMFV
ncbi:sterol O-acyltransferase 1 isoform X1 [Microplitis demolitor]|uniref:sterol O-acyltransferase 1 isoform X1 n=2 Tax=Microplitis demolitor TaxID=69319 RepID=UPI0006D51A02|nr:sterol O-acyltransferase 1 isoform X1 [Microplitis demolitor]XP_053597939.1 sterol O-acyltransferase 1 isoform X1 [Microplitis demolitor]XP_053597940.1 sterol O-acyltransferase 1 isoform X1 [Microplitis demolitor]XP_053597941.1 sterol O-acyltransferase 1 isoform X1 [Microplitis demolitor]XP_053597942.1 sterol O-acyltransferase 1 isoform X1 [Microplitis demolitor]XP_053597943.1 sterol O-acyltransferase 1 isoform X1 [Microplitis demolitor]XP_053597945.1 sterol O-acyltransferase 1 isoform X1 